MKGIAPHTEAIIEQVSRLECIEGWTLVGGTALAIQLDHRKSEDSGFHALAEAERRTHGCRLADDTPTVGNRRRDSGDGYS